MLVFRGVPINELGFIALVPGRLSEGGVLPPGSALAPESALGSLPSVALSSAQATAVLFAPPLDRHWSSNSVGVR